MRENDYDLDKNKAQSVNNETVDDSSNNPEAVLSDETNNLSEKTEIIPQLSEEEQELLERRRNSPEFQKELNDILPSDQGNNEAPKVIELSHLIKKWETGDQEKPKQNKTGLPHELKERYEQIHGLSLDLVRVHYNSSKPAEINALAYAEGYDIYLGPGQEHQLAHELGHVIQQLQGRVTANETVNGVQVNTQKELEEEVGQMEKETAPNGLVEEKEGSLTTDDVALKDSNDSPVQEVAQRNLNQWLQMAQDYGFSQETITWLATGVAVLVGGTILVSELVKRFKAKPSTLDLVRRENPNISAENIGARANMVDFMTMINSADSTFSYPDGEHGLGTTANLWRSSGIAISYQGEDPAAAFEQLLEPHVANYLDCERTALAGVYIAELRSIGAAAFNEKYTGKRLALKPTFQKSKQEKNTPYNIVNVDQDADLRAGDWVYFENHPDYLQHNAGGLWSGEHAYYMGAGKYQGFGTDAHSFEEMRGELANAFEQGYNGDMTRDEILEQVTRVPYIRRPKFLDPE